MKRLMSPEQGENEQELEPGAASEQQAALLRRLQQQIDKLAKKFSFAQKDFEPLQRMAAQAIQGNRRVEAEHRLEHTQTRKKLFALTNGRIERWIFDTGDSGMIRFFKKVWRG